MKKPFSGHQKLEEEIGWDLVLVKKVEICRESQIKRRRTVDGMSRTFNGWTKDEGRGWVVEDLLPMRKRWNRRDSGEHYPF